MAADKDQPKPAAVIPPPAAQPKPAVPTKPALPYGVPPKITARDMMRDFSLHSAVIKQKKLQELARRNPVVADLLKSQTKHAK